MKGGVAVPPHHKEWRGRKFCNRVPLLLFFKFKHGVWRTIRAAVDTNSIYDTSSSWVFGGVVIAPIMNALAENFDFDHEGRFLPSARHAGPGENDPRVWLVNRRLHRVYDNNNIFVQTTAAVVSCEKKNWLRSRTRDNITSTTVLIYKY